MTRCTRNVINLKSSVYNQTGQNYFEQLAAYNSMSSHLRRILLARNIVDTRNKNYLLKKSQRCKVQSIGDEGTYLHVKVTDDVINRLAYDSRHHPMDILRMNLNPKHLDCCNYNLNCHQSRICSGRTCYEETDQVSHRQQLMPKHRRTTSPMTTCSPKRKKFTPNSICGKESTRESPHMINLSTYSQWRKYRYEKDPFFIPCTSTALDSSIFILESQSSIQEMNDHHLTSLSASQSYGELDCDGKTVEQLVSKQFSCKKEEEKKYIKFIYDITREIIQRGLYTDKELQDVFRKHIDQYKGILNMNKMLYEIYQLKISLNMEDDSDMDEELEDLIHAQKLLSVSEIRPPTPPKVLDENKVLEKLESYRKLMEAEDRPSNVAGKSVTLVDANPELLVTERDVLISLMEVGIDPKQAQYVCKNLLQRSKDTAFTEMVQVGAEVHPLNLEVDNSEKLESNDINTSPETETTESIHNSIADSSAKSLVKQKAGSSTSSLISVQNEAIKMREKNPDIESES